MSTSHADRSIRIGQQGLRSPLLLPVNPSQHFLVRPFLAAAGTLLAADMRGGCKGRWLQAAVAGMMQSNGPALPVLRTHGATACTDVTGFGLLGHLAEMARASKVRVAFCKFDWNCYIGVQF